MRIYAHLKPTYSIHYHFNMSVSFIRIKQLVLACSVSLSLIFLSSCGYNLVKPKSAQPPVEYLITLTSLWTSNSHTKGDEFPSSAHFSSPAIATHNAQKSFWAPNQPASKSTELIAEEGGTLKFLQEANEAIANGQAFKAYRGDAFDYDEIYSMKVSANEDFSELTLLTMIAPSPDWFVGVHGLSLKNADGTWKVRISCDLVGYDAGTESGADYSLFNDDTEPRGVIHKLADDAELAAKEYDLSAPFLKIDIQRVGSTNAVAEPC